METKVIKLKPKEIEHIKTFADDHRSAEIGFREACRFKKLTSDVLWGALKDLYPEAMEKKTIFDDEENILRYIDYKDK